MKRILAIALVLSMLLAVCLMAGCGDTNVETTPTPSGSESTSAQGSDSTSATQGSDSTSATQGSDSTSATQGGDETTASTDPGVVPGGDPFADYDGTTKVPGFEDLDFRGTKFVIASSTVASEFSRMPCEDIFSENTDPISVAVRTRNDYVQKLYNCTIQLVQHESPGQLASADVTGNTHTIDLYGISNSGNLGSTSAAALNVLSLDIDFTNPWWDQKFVQSLAAKNSNGVMTLTDLMGDFCVFGMSSTYILGFDKDVYESVGIEGTYGDIYQLVRDGKWTMDIFAEMYKAAAKENSGDSTLKTGDGDILGWCTTNYAPHALHVASGLQIISANDGVMSFQMADHQAEWVDVIDKAIEVWKMPEHENTGYGGLPAVVTGHQTLFFSEVIDALARPKYKDAQGLRVGLVPYPKYTESQEGYYNYVDSHLTTYLVPKSVSEVDALADFLEVFAAHSRYIVRTAWVDAYCYEYCSDTDSSEMLSIILDSRTYDPGYHIVGSVEGDVSSWINNGKNDFSKWVGRNVNPINQKLADNVQARVKGD